MSANKICLLVVWFGDLPSWISYFLRSCSVCHGIDWQIFTDTVQLPTAPDNVVFRHLTKAEFSRIVGDVTATDYQFSYGYKLCDMKPAYGHFFERFLVGYDYWGYTDLDVVIGDPVSMLRKAGALTADVITASDRLLLGHFTLLRNAPRFRLLYQECSAWRKKFLAPDYQVFDEGDFSSYVKSLRGSGAVTLAEVRIVQEDCLIEWSGRTCFFVLWRGGVVWDLVLLRRFGYFHFIRTKYKSTIVPRVAYQPGNWFVITERGFLPIQTASERALCLLMLLVTFTRTLPWYIKQIAKVIIPKRGRLWVRRLAGAGTAAKE